MHMHWLALAPVVAVIGCVPNLQPEGLTVANEEELICAPGHLEECPCPGGGMGWQECALDGSGYTSCFCVDASDPEPVEPYCGDGLIQSGEICDGGNGNDADGCDGECVAPPGTLVWVSGYDGGGALDDCALDIATDSQGYIYAAGFDGHGGVSRAWVRKFTPSGAPVWTHFYIDEQHGAHEARAIAITNKGAVVVGGLDGGNNDENDNNDKDTDAWVQRLDPEDGAEVWTQRFIGAGGYADAIRGITAVHDDSVVVCGEHAKASDQSDAWGARLDHDGEVMWSKPLAGESGDDRATDCALTASGELFVTGVFTEQGQGPRLWVKRVDVESGDELWRHDDFEVEPLSIYRGDVGITSDAAGRVYIAAEIAQPAGDDGHIWTARLDTDAGALGPIVWERTFEFGAEGVRGMAVRTDAAGDLYLATARASGSSVLDDDDILLLKLSPSGKLLWSESYDGASRGDDRGYGLAIDEGGVYVAGVRTVEGNGLDMWIGKFAP